MRSTLIRIVRVGLYTTAFAYLGCVPWLALFLGALLDVLEQRR